MADSVPAKKSRRGRVTLVDVARDAGVSPSTVSLVLNHAPRISKATVAKVHESIDRLEYQYDGRAAALRANTTTTASLILDDVRSRNHAEVTMAVERVLRQHGLVLTVGYHYDETERQEELIEGAARQRVGGLILLPAPGTEETATPRLLRRSNIPFVTIGRHITGLEPSYAGTDNRMGARLVAGHLQELGVRRAVLIGGSTASTAFQERMAEFARARDLDVTAFPAPVTSQGGAEALRTALHRIDGLDAVIAFSDAPALGIVNELRAQGTQERFAVVAFDDNPVFALLGTSVTCVDTFPGSVGTMAAELLWQGLQDPQAPTRSMELTPELRIRDSTLRWRPRRA